MDHSPRPTKRPRLEAPSQLIPPEILLLNLPSLIIYPKGHALHHKSLLLSLEALRKCLEMPGLEPGIECRAWTGTAEIAMMLGMMDVAEKAITKGLVLAQKHPTLKLYYARLILLSARIAQSPKQAQQTLKRFIASPQLSRLPIHIVYTAHLDLIASLSSSLSTSSPIASDSTRALAAINALQTLAQRNSHKQIFYLTTLLRVQVLVNAGYWSKVQDALPSPSPLNSTDSPPPTSIPYPYLADDMHPVVKVLLLIFMVIFYTYKGVSDLSAMALKDLHLLLDSGAAIPPSSPGAAESSSADTHSAAARVGIIEVFPGLWIQSTHPRVLYLLGFLVSSVAKRDPVGRKPKKRVFASEGLAVYEREKERERKGVGRPTSSRKDPMDSDEGIVEYRMGLIKADLLSELVGIAVMRCEFEETERILNELIAHTRSIQIPPSAPQSPKPHDSRSPESPDRGASHYCTLFHDYSARITLHQAHLAHARGHSQKAEECYHVAEWLSSGTSDGDHTGRKDSWVHVCARAGQVSLKFGLLAEKQVAKSTETRKSWDAMLPSSSGPSSDFDTLGNIPQAHAELPIEDDIEDESDDSADLIGEESDLCRDALDVAEECDALGGALCAAGEVLRSCATKEYLKGKNHLRQALSLSTGAQDNHLRALVLALVAARYMYTAKEHAEGMLKVCETLGAGMGATAIPSSASSLNLDGSQPSRAQDSQTPKKGSDHVGNARLRLWVGERFLELHRWAGDSSKASRQRKVNNKLRSALERQQGTTQSQ